MDPYFLIGEVSHENNTTLDVGKHAPEPGEDGTSLTDILDTPSPLPKKIHLEAIIETTNSKEHTITTATPQTHRHRAIWRPSPKPPDKS